MGQCGGGGLDLALHVVGDGREQVDLHYAPLPTVALGKAADLGQRGQRGGWVAVSESDTRAYRRADRGDLTLCAGAARLCGQCLQPRQHLTGMPPLTHRQQQGGLFGDHVGLRPAQAKQVEMRRLVFEETQGILRLATQHFNARATQ
ncbi:hypothetical protein FQZ97_1050270 [compost metagenome]